MLILTGCALNVPLTVLDNFDKAIVANFNFSMEDLKLSDEKDWGELDLLTN